MMKLRRIRAKGADALESGTLSDLSFLLIIYFIVIAGFNANQGFLLGLPAKNSAKLVYTEDIVRARMEGDGSIYVSGMKMPNGEIEDYLSKALAKRPNLSLLLTVAAEAPWQSVVDFMAIAQRRKIENFSFVLDEGSSPR